MKQAQLQTVRKLLFDTALGMGARFFGAADLTGAVETVVLSGGGAAVTVTLPPLTGRVYTPAVARIVRPDGSE